MFLFLCLISLEGDDIYEWSSVKARLASAFGVNVENLLHSSNGAINYLKT